jgi:hypothetical protein
MCVTGQNPQTLDEPCEPGALASDEQDGAAIASKVLLCPPDDCYNATQGCVAHLISSGKDILACGIDTTTAAIGSSYNLLFRVYDSGKPSGARMLAISHGDDAHVMCCPAVGLSADVYRVISVVSPCTATQYYCSDGTCSNVKCNVRDALPSPTNATVPAIEVVLLPSADTNVTTAAGQNKTLYLSYGT